MLDWSDDALVINVRPHGESGAICHVMTRDYGRQAGYVYQATSQKRQAILQPGNLVECHWQARQEGQLGQFDRIDIQTPWPSILMHQRGPFNALQSTCALLSLIVPEHDPHPALYEGTISLLDHLNGPAWLESTILWEIGLLREMGFALDLGRCAVCKTKTDLTHVSPKSGSAVCTTHAAPYKEKLLPLPAFLGGPETHPNSDGLALTGSFLQNWVLGQSNLTLPELRQQLNA